MLTGKEIIRQVELGNIYIDNFNPLKINPNSYNLHLDNKLLVYSDVNMKQITYNANQYDKYFCWNGFEKDCYIDAKKDNPTTEIIIPDDGFILLPNQLYLGTTKETTITETCVPCISGRSSIGRLGIAVHVTAGFGDIGFHGKWTLEITAAIPVKIYPDMEICQIYFEEVSGDTGIQYHGRYQYQDDVQASRLFYDTISEMRIE